MYRRVHCPAWCDVMRRQGRRSSDNGSAAPTLDGYKATRAQVLARSPGAGPSKLVDAVERIVVVEITGHVWTW